MRFHEQLRWVHHGEGTKAHPGPAKPEPVYYRNLIQSPLSLALLGEHCHKRGLESSSRGMKPTNMTPLKNDPQQHQREAKKSRMSRFARRETEPGFAICTPSALEIRSRFSFRSTNMRFHEQCRSGHHDGGIQVPPGPAKPEPVYYRNIIENSPSLTELGEGVISHASSRCV